MATKSWKEFYEDEVVGAIDPDTYTVKVLGGNTLAKSRLVFLNLGVQVGPSAGKQAEVNLYLPNPEAPSVRGQMHNFRKKMAGFNISAALAQMDPDSDVQTQLDILLDALTGQTTTAEIGKQTEGQYAGKNELTSTKPADDAPASAPVQPAAEAAPVTAPEPAPVVPATQPEPALAGEVPF